MDSFINNFNEIIKSFIIINYDINLFFPFYTPHNINNPNEPILNNINFHEECLEYKTIFINEHIFEIKNLYEELNSFVSVNGFVEKTKLTKSNKKIKFTINEYIKNVLWFDLNQTFSDKIIFNIKSFYHNYNNFGFKILDILKTEITNIPVNKNFQNFLTFLIGIWENELNTKIDYYN